MMPQLLIAGGVGTALAASRRYFRDWGASKAECRAVLPGDELVPDPADAVTRAVTIDAPAHEVWRWLVQIGQDRGGMYSYRLLETPDAPAVVPELQHIAKGDVFVIPAGIPHWFKEVSNPFLYYVVKAR